MAPLKSLGGHPFRHSPGGIRRGGGVDSAFFSPLEERGTPQPPASFAALSVSRVETSLRLTRIRYNREPSVALPTNTAVMDTSGDLGAVKPFALGTKCVARDQP